MSLMSKNDIPICLIEIDEKDNIVFINSLFSNELQKIDINSDDLLGKSILTCIKKFNREIHRENEYIHFGNKSLYCMLSVQNNFVYIEIAMYNTTLIKYINQEFRKPLTTVVNIIKLLSDTNYIKKKKTIYFLLYVFYN